MNLPKTSFIVHVTGLKKNFSVVTEKIDSLFEAQREDYEILFVADEFLESVEWDVRVFLSHYPVKLLKRRGPAGRGYNIQRGLRNSKFETVCVLEMGSKYPVEVIGQMLTSIRDLDIVGSE
jgi:hypothetical protein